MVGSIVGIFGGCCAESDDGCFDGILVGLNVGSLVGDSDGNCVG